MTEGKAPQWRCAACGVEAASCRWACSGCGVEGAWIWVGVGRGAVRAGEAASALEPVGFGGGVEESRALGGGFPRSTVTVIWGGPGVGKTTIASRFGVGLARRLERELLVVSWESAREVTALAMVRGGAASALVTEREDWETEANELGAGVVVVDSVSVGAGSEEVRRASAWAGSTGGVVLATCQVTSKDEIRGGPGVEHYADCSVRLTRGAAAGLVDGVVGKCRWAVGGSFGVSLVSGRSPR